MRASSSLFLKGQIPLTNLHLRNSKFPKGMFNVKMHPVMCLCNNIQTNSYEVANGSYVPTGQTKENNTKKKPSGKTESIGAFQKLPMVMPSIDILGSALRKAKRISPTKGIANIAKRERNKGAKQLDALMKVLGNVDALRKRIVSVGKEHASLCAKSSSKREAEERLDEGLKKIEGIFAQERKVIEDLLDIAKTLRAMPVINLETPTLCLVGAPNVGKSSLVRVLSTGKPEICNYPFTTRGILMGHIVLNYQRFQVTDTPGLLKRHDDDRNNLEKLTLAVLSHLPTAILYVHDLSGECGTSPSDQFTISKEIKERFPEHLWLDVVSKSDLFKKAPVVYATEDADPTQLELAKYRKSGPDGAIYVSVKTEEGLNELKCRVHELLNMQMDKIKDINNKQEE